MLLCLLFFALIDIDSGVNVPFPPNFSFDIAPGISSFPGNDHGLPNPSRMPINPDLILKNTERENNRHSGSRLSFSLPLGESSDREAKSESESSAHDGRNQMINFGGDSQGSSPDPPQLPPPPRTSGNTGSVPSSVAAINFGDDLPIDLKNCSFKNGLAMYDGVCSRLLSSSSCAPGYWLILTRQEFPVPFCAKKRCRGDTIPYKHLCVEAFNQTACNAGEILYLDFFGDSHCDCESTFVYDENLTRCIAEHNQGSCPDGQYIEMDAHQNIVCADNPCKDPKLILHVESGVCYKKNFTGNCNKNNTQLNFDHELFVATCSITSRRNIFEVPAINSCPPGTKRNHLRVCQSVLKVEGRAATSYRVPTRYSTYSHACPYGYQRYPDNSCRKRNPLFG